MPSGAELLSSDDKERFLAIRLELQRRAAKARECPFAFMEFVIREEKTQKPIKVAPHQRVGIEFILAHDRSVNFWPINHAKTFSLGALSLWMLGREPNMRGAIVSNTQGQAEKVVKFVRDYIETSFELQLVFPHLRRSLRRGDSWTQTALTVDRPPGIRDPSLIAVGYNGALAGSRLSWIVIDDILDMENTATREQRLKVIEWVDSIVLSRLDPKDTRVAVINTPWHREDLPHELERRGWASMRMSILGDITLRDDHERRELAFEKREAFIPWDSEHIRPSDTPSYNNEEVVRLVAHEPDPSNDTPLWPERFDKAKIARLRREHLPHRFNQLFLMKCYDDETARCKLEWIEKCKALARKRGVKSLTSAPPAGIELVFTGVDLAVSPGEENDLVALFTFAVLSGGFRQILDIEAGHFDGPTIVNKLFTKQAQYGSIVRVENNGSQDYILQFARQRDISFPVRPHTTGRVKAHPEHGVEGLFLEIYNGAWLIPNDDRGRCQPEVQAWIDDCLNYLPSKHTPDRLMASYFAREQAKAWGVLSGSDTADMAGPSQSIGLNIMAR